MDGVSASDRLSAMGSEAIGSPLVSIIIPAFNSALYIGEAIRSVLDQTYAAWELIVVDDCSMDNTTALVEQFGGSDPRVRLLKSQSNQGAAQSRNMGLDRASGKYVAFLDADDRWHAEKLTRQVEFMEAYSLEFTFTAYLPFSHTREYMQAVDRRSADKVNYAGMLAKRATIGCSTVMLSRTMVGELRMPNIRTGQDYAFWLCLLKRGLWAHRLNEVLTYYRVRPDSISANKYLKARRQWQIYRQIEGVGVFRSLYYFSNYAYGALVRK